jgi:anion-transporting  ArsA/GET3 family ATPase
MMTRIFCGKGGVGKTSLTCASARYYSMRGHKTAVIDYDGGHSVAMTLGVQGSIPGNTIHPVSEHLSLVVIEKPAYRGILDAKKAGVSFELYVSQFQGDAGIVPYADMVSQFFGVPADVPTLQKFAALVSAICELHNQGFEYLFIDMEPTAGLERLLSQAHATLRSLQNLRDTGVLTLTMLKAKWPDIVAYLRGDFIQNIDVYGGRVKQAVAVMTEATYRLVCIPEQSPVNQTLEVRQIIESFGGKVCDVIVNNMRGESHEESNVTRLRKLHPETPVILVPHKKQFHDGSDPASLLAQIGEMLQGNRD